MVGIEYSCSGGRGSEEEWGARTLRTGVAGWQMQGYTGETRDTGGIQDTTCASGRKPLGGRGRGEAASRRRRNKHVAHSLQV